MLKVQWEIEWALMIVLDIQRKLGNSASKKRAYPLWSGCYGIFPAFLNTYPAQIPDIYRCIPFNSDRLSFFGDLQITIGTV